MLIHINSSLDRQPTDKTHKWTTYFPFPIELTDNAKVGVKNIEIPNVSNQFKQSNSVFWIAIDGVAFGLLIDFTKFYETLQSVVESLNAQVLQYIDYNGSGFNAEFSIDNNRLVLSNTGSCNIRFVSSRAYEHTFNGDTILNGTNYNGALFNQMNMKMGIVGDFRGKWILPNASMKSDGTPKLIRTNCYYLTSDIIDNGGIIPNPNISPIILCKIPVLSNFGSLITYEPQRRDYFPAMDNTLDRADFRILDDEYEEADLNGANVSITLEIIQ